MTVMGDCLRMSKLYGATIVAFDARGCMAEDHRFQWLGVVTSFGQTEHAGMAAKIRILKSEAGGGYDCRDHDLGTVIHPIHDGALQELAPNLFILVR